MATKSKMTPEERLIRAFEEDLNDNELQLRYDRFVRDRDFSKEKYNELVPKINEEIAKMNRLHEAIFNTVLEGIMPTEVVDSYKEVVKRVEALTIEIESAKSKMKENETLIDKYKSNSHDRLFGWWKAIKAADPKTESWIEWSKPYKDRII